MEQILNSFQSPLPPPPTKDLLSACLALAHALRHLPIRIVTSSESNSDSPSLAHWLLSQCSSSSSFLSPLSMAESVLAALDDESALFDLFGETRLDVLMEITDKRDQLINITNEDIRLVSMENSTNDSDSRETGLLQLKNRVFETRDRHEALSIAEKSNPKLKSDRKKAQREAAQALTEARQAGALTESDELMLFPKPEPSSVPIMTGGGDPFVGGLPKGTFRETKENVYEKVIIPPPPLDRTGLRERIVLDEVMDGEERRAFEGTRSLNPMQSTVFEVTYGSRENLLICAPTGAGKTNVAMLAVVSHLKDVGLFPSSHYDYDTNTVTTGKKIVYIAPMKALAQEVVEKFSSKLKPLKIIVRELTGDMQLSRTEAEAAHILVTTPEKWDVVTRKGGDGTLGSTCGLLIIDEVHLLADERGAVIESVVARLHRLVESSQRQVRLVGLSATLPNYEDVAKFLRVDTKGLFYFGPEFRPVPLQQTFIGVTAHPKDKFQREKVMDDVCYEVVTDALRNGHQVMVFVHSRKGTGTTAKALAERAATESVLESLFIGDDEENDARTRHIPRVEKSRNRELVEHFRNGMGIHHAGMLRNDRKLSEEIFNDGAIKVLCCTATLAWGINLPAHTVVIKGTDVHLPEKGKNVDLSILDVQQIFGRAGRPQFDTSGDATLITTHDAMARYLDKLVRSTPIESNFIKQLADHMNAEVVAGTVTTISEAVEWIQYTYLHVRMCQNPLAYGISADQKESDPTLHERSRELALDAAKLLDERKMIRFHPNGNLAVANLGRVASHFYIRNESIAIFNDMLEKGDLSVPYLCHIMCCANEFENIRVRQDELDEVDKLAKQCRIGIIAPVEDFSGKCNVLLQAYVSKSSVSSFTLISDTNYIASNAARVARALFEICLKTGRASPALKFIRLAKSIDHRFWWFQSPLRHFESELPKNVLVQLEDKKKILSEDGTSAFELALSLLDMDPNEVGQLCHCYRDGNRIQKHVRILPNVRVTCTVHPITMGILRLNIQIEPTFTWSLQHHGGAVGIWLWVEDSEVDKTYHNEYIIFSRRNHPETSELELIIPVFDPIPQQYFIRVVSDSWVGCESLIPVSFRHILLDGLSSPTYFTNLIDLTPLPIHVLADHRYEQLYSKRFEVFNPIQTQLFHVLYHCDVPVLLCAPTGSGKTIVAELALLRMKRLNPQSKCVYIAPLKSLARERLKEWSKRFGAPPLKWKVLELSGDTSHDSNSLNNADVLICTPEKWDLISRGWRAVSQELESSSVSNGRQFVRQVGLLIIDEIHLLGEERGAVLEAIVSRTRFISKFVQAERKSAPETKSEMTRILGLSTALANPVDLADWLGIDVDGFENDSKRGLYNFRPSVRPVPMVAHIQGYPGKHYCPRMATMNKPCYAAIKDYSPSKPSLIFVASRRQTRLTALALISYSAGDENPKSFLHCEDNFIEAVAESLDDKVLQHTITFGIGLHHAGLTSRDRETVEKLYLDGHIQVLIATATLAWGVNLPAHLVIVKGTEYFDGKNSRYVDYPVTDILQMMGRAGRPQFDTEGVAVIMCEESKKIFLKKFLYEPLPVESCLEERLCETMNAEISIGTVSSLSDGLGYLRWTFYSRRVKLNPSYYGAQSSSEADLEEFYLSKVRATVAQLHEHGCILIDESRGNDHSVTPTPLGHSCSNFYLNHKTPIQMKNGALGLRGLLSQHSISDGGPELRSHEFIDDTLKQVESLRTFSADNPMHQYALAKIMFELAWTHEFDEIPVRHNEEELNLELSRSLPWGHDLSKLEWWTDKKKPQVSLLDIMMDPHTKCFLLLQAYCFQSKLPITDYINDMRSVADQIPRLLAAMEYIALEDKTSAGCFEMFSCFPIVRRMFSTGAIMHSPVSQRDRIRFATYQLRKLSKELKKGSNRRVGLIEIAYQLDGKLFKQVQNRKSNSDRDNPSSVTLILGTRNEGYLLQRSSFTIPDSVMGRWTKNISLDFDWDLAESNGGDSNLIILRIVHEFTHSSDVEMAVSLKHAE